MKPEDWDFSQEPPAWTVLVEGLPSAEVKPSAEDRIAALERLTVAIAKADPKTANLADLAAVEAVVISDATLDQPIL